MEKVKDIQKQSFDKKRIAEKTLMFTGLIALSGVALAAPDWDVDTAKAAILSMATPIGVIGAAKVTPKVVERGWRIINRFI